MFKVFKKIDFLHQVHKIRKTFGLVTSSLFIFTIILLNQCQTTTQRSFPSAIASIHDTLKKTSELAGILIYEGSVFSVGEATHLFVYERRVKSIPNGFAATHITRDLGHNVILAQTANYTPNYQLHSFEYTNWQANYRATLQIKDSQLFFQLTDKMGHISVNVEKLNESIVVGPTLFGFIREHWNDFSKGSPISVRFAAPELKQTFGFEIRKIQDTASLTRFEMKPTNWILRLAMNPFIFDFDPKNQSIITYTGRVPPMRTIDGKLKEFEARVTYVHHAEYQ